MTLARLLFAVAVVTLVTPGTPAVAEDVVPDHEKRSMQELGAEGPTETTGIESAVVLGSIPLGGEFPGLEGRVLRMREVTVAAGGTVAVHRHEQRPGVAYVVEGEITEHRSGEAGALLRKAGDAAFENSGTVHWWVNESGAPARVVVVDIVPADE